MQVQSYMFFEGRCEEALEFYGKALGAKVQMMMRYKDCPVPPPGDMAGKENKVMHASFTIGETTLLASDGHCTGKTYFQGFSQALIVATEKEADRAFAALSDGGKVAMPLDKTFFSPRFGMATDRFGVTWMILVRA